VWQGGRGGKKARNQAAKLQGIKIAGLQRNAPGGSEERPLKFFVGWAANKARHFVRQRFINEVGLRQFDVSTHLRPGLKKPVGLDLRWDCRFTRSPISSFRLETGLQFM
jgi:hypothetical protein